MYKISKTNRALEKDVIVAYRPRRNRGMGLLDVLLALTAATVMLAGLAQLQGDLRQSQTAQTVAHQLTMLADAAQSYLNENSQNLSSKIVPVNGVVEIPLIGNSTWQGIGDLQNGGGLLSQSFQPILPNGQIMHLLVRNVPTQYRIPQHLEAMIVTSGPALNDRQVGLAMNAMEGNGGGIMSRPLNGNYNVIQGSFGSWGEPISTWAAAGVPLTPGHVAYTMNTIGSPLSDYLNRYNTGNPEANRMHTDIDDNNNNINNVNTVDTEYVKNSRADNVHFMNMISGDGVQTQVPGSNVTNAVQFQDGGNFCTRDNWACGVQISDDGGFYDLNDSWITFVNPTGGGAAGLYLKGANLAVDKDVRIQGTLGTNGMDPENNYPGGFTPGIHTKNVYAEGEVATGYGENIAAYMNPNGDIYGSDILTMGNGVHVMNGPIHSDYGAIYTNDGDIYTGKGNIVATNGIIDAQGSNGNGRIFADDGIVSGNFMYAQNSIESGSNVRADNDLEAVNGNLHLIDSGNVLANNGSVQAQVFHLDMLAPENTSCSGITVGVPGQPNRYTIQNGDLASSGSNDLLVCIGGVWRRLLTTVNPH